MPQCPHCDSYGYVRLGAYWGCAHCGWGEPASPSDTFDDSNDDDTDGDGAAPPVAEPAEPQGEVIWSA